MLWDFYPLSSPSRKSDKGNEFSWAPILEVAYLFAGIFMTIIPALAILKAGENGALALANKISKHTGTLFLGCGILSSFLDNAPTYLTFFNSALGKFYPGDAGSSGRCPADCGKNSISRGHIRRSSFHGSKYLYRQCAQFYG